MGLRSGHGQMFSEKSGWAGGITRRVLRPQRISEITNRIRPRISVLGRLSTLSRVRVCTVIRLVSEYILSRVCVRTVGSRSSDPSKKPRESVLDSCSIAGSGSD